MIAGPETIVMKINKLARGASFNGPTFRAPGSILIGGLAIGSSLLIEAASRWIESNALMIPLIECEPGAPPPRRARVWWRPANQWARANELTRLSGRCSSLALAALRPIQLIVLITTHYIARAPNTNPPIGGRVGLS